MMSSRQGSKGEVWDNRAKGKEGEKGETWSWGTQRRQAASHTPYTHACMLGLGCSPDNRPTAPQSLEPQFLEGSAAGIID